LFLGFPEGEEEVGEVIARPIVAVFTDLFDDFGAIVVLT
jgi:hypothetical protein